MSDRFFKKYTELDSIAYDGFPITANDSVTFSQPPRAIYVGGTGDITLETLGYEDGVTTTLTFASVPAGMLLPIRASKVYSNTTANSLIGIF